MENNGETTEVGLALLKWFEESGRQYSFRWPGTPFRALVAAVLLRQTRGSQVDDVFEQFMEQYPTPTALSRAKLGQLSPWLSRLGIVSRARDLLGISETMVDEFNGEVPRDYEALVGLQGVGDYIASFTLTAGYGESIPVIDSVTARVISRLAGFRTAYLGGESICAVYHTILGTGREEDMHYALIDLANAYCLHDNPRCSGCPMACFCERVQEAQVTEGL